MPQGTLSKTKPLFTIRCKPDELLCQTASQDSLRPESVILWVFLPVKSVLNTDFPYIGLGKGEHIAKENT